MNAIQKRRLLKLADFLDKLPREKFDFSQIAVQAGKPMKEALRAGKTRCGTVGCAVGWMPAVFPRQFRWAPGWSDAELEVCPRGDSDDYGYTDIEAAAEFFGLWSDDAAWLFVPGHFSRTRDRSNDLGDGVAPKTVARHIRKFVKESERATVAA